MRKLIIVFVLIILFGSCQKNNKEAMLLADREAPLGWVYLRIFEDYTFEFESRGFLERKGIIYDGTVEMIGDTLIFDYYNEIPYAGTKAIIKNNGLSYINGSSNEGLKIKLNNLN